MTRRPYSRPAHILFADVIADMVNGLQQRVESRRAKALESHTRHIIDNLPLKIRKDIGWR